MVKQWRGGAGKKMKFSNLRVSSFFIYMASCGHTPFGSTFFTHCDMVDTHQALWLTGYTFPNLLLIGDSYRLPSLKCSYRITAKTSPCTGKILMWWWTVNCFSGVPWLSYWLATSNNPPTPFCFVFKSLITRKANFWLNATLLAFCSFRPHWIHCSSQWARYSNLLGL